MLEKIAMWGGIAGCILAIITIIAVLYIQGSIKRILNKDEIIFDSNFALKKQAIESAMNLIDKLEQDNSLVNSDEFKKQAKLCYNQMLCVTSNLKLVELFYSLTIEGTPASHLEYKQFKYACRKDIGFSTTKITTPKEVVEKPKAVKQPKIKDFDNLEREVFSMPGEEVFEEPKPKAKPVEQVTQPVRRPVNQQGVQQIGRPASNQTPTQRPTVQRRRTDIDF